MLLSFDYSRVIAGLEDRIQFLTKKYPAVPEESIEFLSKCDPAKGKYLEYLTSQRAKGILIDSDDDSTCWVVQHALELFTMVNQSKKVREYLQDLFPISDIPTEIFKIDIKTLYRLAVAHYDDIKKAIGRFKGTKKQGKVIYQDDTYKILALFVDPAGNYDDLIAEVCAYGAGKWCTQYKNHAENYLASGGLYIVFKNGKSLLQTDGRTEYKDVTNHNFDFSEFSDLVVVLIKVGLIKLPKGARVWNRDEMSRLSYYHNITWGSGPVHEYLTENRLI